MPYLQSRRIRIYTKEVSLSVNMEIGCIHHPLRVFFLKPPYCSILDLVDGFDEQDPEMSKATSTSS